jgi:hypothetical protein
VEATEVLTLDEIKARFAPDWVLIGDPEVDELHRVLAGRVLFHSRIRDEVYQNAIELRPARSAFRFLGTILEDMVLLGLDFLRDSILTVDFRAGDITLG